MVKYGVGVVRWNSRELSAVNLGAIWHLGVKVLKLVV